MKNRKKEHDHPVGFGEDSVSITVYTNEPADCKWTHEIDKSYIDIEEANSLNRNSEAIKIGLISTGLYFLGSTAIKVVDLISEYSIRNPEIFKESSLDYSNFPIFTFLGSLVGFFGPEIERTFAWTYYHTIRFSYKGLNAIFSLEQKTSDPNNKL